MARLFCKNHQDQNLNPLMIQFGESALGKEYICCVCSSVRVLNEGTILSLNGNYGFISGGKKNFFFHFNNLAYGFTPFLGMRVEFEVCYLEDGRNQAVNIKPKGGKNGD
ncbi:cold shock domain-containing protein [bacterium]|nr:cold shock domain-containing protein [bacterium]